jgi:hypothetical protein
MLLSNGTIDYQARRFDIDFELTPYYPTTPLNFTAAQQTLKLSNIRTILEYERHNTKTTGLNALAARAAQAGFPANPNADPQMPIAAENYTHLSLDVEGIVSNADGT